MLGLSRGSAVSVYQGRYADMPRPVVSKGDKKARLWLRSEILTWQQSRRSGV